MITTPLNKWHHANEAKMVDFGGWDMPLQYKDGILREHLATRKFGGIFDVSHMGRFRIKGSDRIKFLQHVLSNNAEALEPWQAQYTLIPNENGGVIDDAYLYRFDEDDYLLVVNASNKEKDWAHLQHEAKAFSGLELEDHTDLLAMIAFQGPLTSRILDSLLDTGSLPEPFRNRLSSVEIQGSKVLLARTGYTGEPVCFELFLPASSAEKIWTTLLSAGEEQGVRPVGLGARDTLRLEAGMPLYGHEFGTDPDGCEFPAFCFPLARLAVSFSERKGPFVGRAALEEQAGESQKINMGTYIPTDILRRRILPVALIDKGVIRQGYDVFCAGQKVGFVTSGTTVPYWLFEGEGAMMKITDSSSRRAVGLACVDAELQAEQDLEVVVRGKRLRARIVRWHGRSEAPPYFRAIPVEWTKPITTSVSGALVHKAEILLNKTLANHEWRQRRCFNMIPSEMTPSPMVRLLQVMDPVGRYAEHKELLAAFGQEVFYYQGTDFIAWVEERLAQEMSDFLGCPLIESRVISGQMANVTIFSALIDFNNRIDRRREPNRIKLVVNNHLGKGGHLSAQPMGALRDYVARNPVTERYAVLNFPVRKDNPYMIDIDETAMLLDRYNPELMILGKSMVLHPEPLREIRAMLDSKPNPPIVMYDMAHVLGLIGPHFQEPFKDGADIVTGSTHKTFFGTQRGIIGAAFEKKTPQYDLWKAVQRRAFPGMVSNHHLGSFLGLLMSTLEMNAFKDLYQPQVIANAKAFARALDHEGLKVEGDSSLDFTETHQVIVNVGYAKGCEVAMKLEENNIIVNYQAIPSDESFTASSGLRIGVSEMTRFGMKEHDFEELAGLFADVVKKGLNVGPKVAKLRKKYLTMQYCFTEEIPDTFKKKFLTTF
ncbi:MAG: glycine cleavage system aminomethyltransferase GcvT [Kiritimatiellae bacterium]|nr:glycine cleavage system aminomethyltransferase GcvT [Kiritimatiellia bacterium]